MKRGIVFLSALLLSVMAVNVCSREPLTFEERVKAQEAIERVYYNHRIWPKENPQPKPPFEKMVTKEQIEAKVTDYLKKCSALDQFWQRPIVASQLQAEMDRMAKGSKDPAILNELFAALNNDPYLIAECLARPVLADRLIHNWYTNDERFHKETREKAEEAMKVLTPENFCHYSEGQFSKITYRLEIEGREEMEEPDSEDNSVKLDDKEFASIAAELPEEGKISEIEERNDFFVVVHTIDKNEGELEIESLTFQKTGVDEWLKSQDIHAESPEIESTSLYLPPMPESACTEGWDNGILDDVPDARHSQTAVWTGTEMIIWGGQVAILPNGKWSTGGRYNPSIDSWQPTSLGTNIPNPRAYHTAVWSGTEMIIWGGETSSFSTNTGGRYNPLTDSWISTSTGTGCPTPRSYHTAVWTGSKMIIWGGAITNTGGIYNPLTDSWTSTSTGTNCPAGRSDHTAVWTGSEMIVWGGGDSITCFNTGGKYDPNTDSWKATSTGGLCPSVRYYHTAVWTGTAMVVWGGRYKSSPYYCNTGGVYDPSMDSWTATSTETNCPSMRCSHTAIWTGSEMIVWGGGSSSYKRDGGKYNPLSDTWSPTSTGSNCPTSRKLHSAVWTGKEMIVWGGGGDTNTGGRYDPSTDSWIPTYTVPNCPVASAGHTAIWTGTEMIISSVAKYNPSTDSWTSTSTTNRPYGQSAVWTGAEMIIWGTGGSSCGSPDTGGKYNPVSDSWNATSTGTDCPSVRYGQSAVWTGTEMVVWGGICDYPCIYYLNYNNGGRYNPETDNWLPVSTGTNCPTGRGYHSSTWTGTAIIVWGGYSLSFSMEDCITYEQNTSTGGKYYPSTDSWLPTSSAGSPNPNSSPSAVWTGKEMLLWGMTNGACRRYDPYNDAWGTVSATNKPSKGAIIWTGREMVVWSGYGSDGGKYEPSADTWNSLLPGSNPLQYRSDYSDIWTGNAMIIWGGINHNSFQSGGIYYIPYAPYGWHNNFSSDDEGCASDSGVLVEWSSPTWGDGGSGTRSFDVLRDSAPIATGLSESTLSYIDTTGDNGVSYLYQVRANNGCGLSTTTTGMSAADNIGTTPEEVSNFDDVYSWDAVSGADGYRLYRGTLADLPNLMTLTTDGCLKYDGMATSYDLSGDNPSEATGGLYWYLVAAYTGACEGTAGEGTGFTRLLSSSGSCP